MAFSFNPFSQDAKSTPAFAGVIPAPVSQTAGSNKISLRQRVASLRVWFIMQPTWIRIALRLITLVSLVGLTFLARHLYLQNAPNLGVPVDWRKDCDAQPKLNETLVNELKPARIFFGVMTMDDTFARRHMIRSTYLRFKPASVEFKFVLGRPREEYAELVAAEQDVYNDILVLDIEENMNEGKTYHYFKWVAENHVDNPYDFAAKADDDAFVMLDRLEKNLRVLPKQMSYWGYMVGNMFMGGECYALSWDLITWISTSEIPARKTHGHEDSLVAWWFQLGESELALLPGARPLETKTFEELKPNLPPSFRQPRSSVHFHPEQCNIFDDPASDTVYSHQFEESDTTQTIAVHYLKSDERFLRASNILLGGESTWTESPQR